MLGTEGWGFGLEKVCHSTGSRDLAEAARDEVYVVDILKNSMGGVIEEIGVWLATKLGEKGIQSEMNV